MVNIIKDEKRMVRIGEVCAINLKDIRPVCFYYESIYDEPDKINFFSDDEYEKEGISSNDEITFVEYVGDGLFKDLVTGQLLITETEGLFIDKYDNCVDVSSIDKLSQDEIMKISKKWDLLCETYDHKDFFKSFFIFYEMPLLINLAAAPFMTIDSDNLKKISQSYEQIKRKIELSRRETMKNLSDQLSVCWDDIAKIFCFSADKSLMKARKLI